MLQKNILKILHETIIDYQADYTAEAISFALNNRGFPQDQIIYQPLGSSKRPYRKDLSKYTLIEDNEELLFIHVNREGLYDGLPELIFHRPINNYSDINRFEFISRIKKYRKEEQDARLFFLPYEQEFYNLKLSIEYLHGDFEYFSNNSKMINMMGFCWSIFKRLDNTGACFFLLVLPTIHKHRNDFEKIGEYLSIILNIPIKVFTQISFIKSSEFKNYLGNTILGIDLIIGENISDGEKDVIINVGPLKKESYYYFLEAGPKYKLIEELCDFFIGANYFTTINYIYEKPIEAINLGENFLLGIDAFV